MGDGDRVVGEVTSSRVHEGELLLTVSLRAPLDASDVAGRAEIGGFHDGSPLGTKIEARFDGLHTSGMVEISVFDKTITWRDGVFDVNAARFIGQIMTIRPERS